MSTRNPKVSRKTLINIVEEVRKRPCLWKPDDEYHNNRGRVAVAWEEVTANLNIPEPLIRAKWKSMRDIFKREMKKCKINVKGDWQYTGKWRHFKLMSFLQSKESQPVDCAARDGSSSSTDQDDIKEEVVDNDEETDEFGDTGASYAGGSIFAMDFAPGQESTPVKRQACSENDYDLMFLKSLVPYFKELDPVRKLRIRNKIQDIIITEISAQGNHSSSH